MLSRRAERSSRTKRSWRRKRKAEFSRQGSRSFVIGGPLADAEDLEFRRLDWRHSHHADQPAIIEIVLRHGRSVAANEVRFLRPGPQEFAGLPLVQEEILNRCA